MNDFFVNVISFFRDTFWNQWVTENHKAILICALIIILILWFLLRSFSRDCNRDFATIQNLSKSLDSSNGRAKQNEQCIAEQCRKITELESNISNLSAINSDLSKANAELSAKNAEISKLNQYSRYKNTAAFNVANKYLGTSSFKYSWSNDPDYTRIYNAMFDELVPHAVTVAAEYISKKDGSVYHTTLSSCTCPDFKFNTKGTKPCKHMYALALEFGLFVTPLDSKIKDEIRECSHQKIMLDKERAEINKIVNTRSQKSPWLAEHIASYYALKDDNAIDALSHTTKKDVLKELSAKKRELTKERNMLKSQLSYLRYSFPWLDEFITHPPARDISSEPEESGYIHFKDYLSQAEYNALSESERCQLSLDRYENANRARSAWEAGIIYERYIGYQCEQRGYSVQYRGAIDGLEDMGRDVIAEMNQNVYIIQCKRWNQDKTIHEKHIFQLYGSAVLYKLNHPEKNAEACFVTTAKLSSTAKNVAEHLGVIVSEGIELAPYPKIKCNIGKSGEKIFHLPFDQQYDRIIIDPTRGECYCDTVAKAEALGFRHAHKWSASKENSFVQEKV